MKEGVSIVICTYNGANRLAETLRHIALQKVPISIKWEVLLIDNASTDNSAQVAEELWETYACNAPLHILHQPIQGLSFARDMGFQRAEYECILMCDDDNWLNDNYIAIAYTILQSHPTVGMVGGHGTLVFETEPPKWVINFPIHAGGPQIDRLSLVRSHGLYGAGSILRKSAYEVLCSAGFKFMLTDRTGPNFSSGGDIELCYAIALAGYRIYYDDRLQFKHFIPQKRTTWDYYIHYLNESSLSHTVLEPLRIYLLINTKNLFIFRLVLLSNCLLRTLHLLFHISKKYILHLTSSNAQLIDLRVIILKAKLSTYKNHNEMVTIFRKAVNIRQYFAS